MLAYRLTTLYAKKVKKRRKKKKKRRKEKKGKRGKKAKNSIVVKNNAGPNVKKKKKIY